MEDNFDHDGLFDDKDEALDYILYRESEKEEQKLQSHKGCLGILFLLTLPIGSICVFYIV